VGRCRLDESGSGWGPAAGCSEHGDEPSCSIQDGEFLDYASEYTLVKKDSAPWNYLGCSPTTLQSTLLHFYTVPTQSYVKAYKFSRPFL
jgi:hypothetical protein